MSNPVPLSEQKINEIISKCDHEIQENYDAYLLMHNRDEVELFDENGKSLTEDEINSYIEILEESLEVERPYSNIILIKKINLAIFNGSTFEFLEVRKDGTVELKDENEDTFSLSEDGIMDLCSDAFDKLTRGGWDADGRGYIRSKKCGMNNRKLFIDINNSHNLCQKVYSVAISKLKI